MLGMREWTGSSNEAEGARGGSQGRSMVEAGAGDSVRKARKWVQKEEGGEETGSQAGGNAPRGGAWARRVAEYGKLSQAESGEASGRGGFPHQAGQGGQVGPDVSQEDEGFAPW